MNDFDTSDIDSLPEPAPADDRSIENDLTGQQYALLDAVRDIALAPDNPASGQAAAALIRLLDLSFGVAHPEPVEREGGLVGMLFGNPIRPGSAEPEPKTIIVPVADFVQDAIAQGREAAAFGPWPFKVGDVVEERLGCDPESWLDLAPVGTVLRDCDNDTWRKRGDRQWSCSATSTATPFPGAKALNYGPLIVMEVPGGAK